MWRLHEAIVASEQAIVVAQPVAWCEDTRRQSPHWLLELNMFNTSDRQVTSPSPVACSEYTQSRLPRQSPRIFIGDRSRRSVAATIASRIRHITDNVSLPDHLHSENSLQISRQQPHRR